MVSELTFGPLLEKTYDINTLSDAIAQKPPSDDSASWGHWLEEVQAAMGIVYEHDEEAIKDGLRVTFQRMIDGIPGAVSGVGPSFTYEGFRRQTRPDGGEIRASLWRLLGVIVLPAGTQYTVQIAGPFGELDPAGYQKEIHS